MTKLKRAPVVAIACWLGAAAAFAQPRAIDAEKSGMKVRVYKAGLLSALGHEHEISAPVAGGSVDTTSREVALHINASSLRVIDQGISDPDRAEIQSTMTGPLVLDAERFPEIVFRASAADKDGNGVWAVEGSLTLHGQTHRVTADVRETAGHFTGTARLRQSDFGITPIRVAGGTIRVKDEIQIEFDIQLAR